MPLAYADQFYVLREHIGFVRQRLTHGRASRARGADERPRGEPHAQTAAVADRTGA